MVSGKGVAWGIVNSLIRDLLVFSVGSIREYGGEWADVVVSNPQDQEKSVVIRATKSRTIEIVPSSRDGIATPGATVMHFSTAYSSRGEIKDEVSKIVFRD